MREIIITQSDERVVTFIPYNGPPEAGGELWVGYPKSEEPSNEVTLTAEDIQALMRLWSQQAAQGKGTASDGA